jgi:predicted GNAT superfamily acetyltransferase
MAPYNKTRFTLRILETIEEMQAVQELQSLVWSFPGTDIIPLHVLVTFAHNGGLVIGAFTQGEPDNEEEEASRGNQDMQNRLVGFVLGFPGLYFTPDGPRPKHCSHELGVHPDYRRQGLGFILKRAQWQMVRHQGLDLITWTYDPLVSENAHLNIVKLGAVCSTYLRQVYGDMHDGLNAGLPSDRFQVDWWVNSQRVQRRLSRRARPPLGLADFLSAGAEIINPAQTGPDGYVLPAQEKLVAQGVAKAQVHRTALILVEIPSDILALKAANPSLALEWRLQTRMLFEDLFSLGYLVVDFVYVPGIQGRSFYLLSHGENTL